MNADDTKARFIAASKLLAGETTTLEKFESIRDLIKGINPHVDRAVAQCSDALSKIERLSKGDVVQLSADALPENTEEEKKRKKAILFFIKTWRELAEEVERIKSEFEDTSDKNSQEQIAGFGKSAAFAKGPFGIITLAAVILAAVLIYFGRNQSQVQTQSSLSTSTVVSTPTPSPSLIPSSSPSSKKKVKVITYNNKKIALKELRVATGPDCVAERVEVTHYHALERIAVRALDGTTIQDPGSCGFGKVEEVKVEEVDAI